MKPHSLIRIPQKVKSWMSGSTSERRIFPQFKVPNRSSLFTTCLNIHLQPFHKVLLEGHVADKHGIVKTASQIIDVLNLFLSRCVIVSKSKCAVPWQDNDAIRKVSQLIGFELYLANAHVLFHIRE